MIVTPSSPSRPCGVGELDEPAGDAPERVRARELLALEVGQAQAADHDLVHDDPDARVLVEQRPEVAGGERERRHRLDRDHRRRARLVLDRGDFAEQLARADEAEHDLLAVLGERDGLGAALGQHEDPRRLLAFAHHRGPRLNARVTPRAFSAPARPPTEHAEEVMLTDHADATPTVRDARVWLTSAHRGRSHERPIGGAKGRGTHEGCQYALDGRCCGHACACRTGSDRGGASRGLHVHGRRREADRRLPGRREHVHATRARHAGVVHARRPQRRSRAAA